ncbi:MAG: hypothetical protein JNG89_00225 [Planctomycetaceae bacterium]|nr:hypothetical protein [Planctomycetaceae bacterium]
MTAQRVAIVAVIAVLLVIIAAFAYQVHANRAFDQAWRSDLAGLGARVVASRETYGLPLVDIRVSRSTNIDVYVTKAATADAVVERAVQNPKLNRVFLFLSAFDRETADELGRRIQQLRPDVQIILGNADRTVERWVPLAVDE